MRRRGAGVLEQTQREASGVNAVLLGLTRCSQVDAGELTSIGWGAIGVYLYFQVQTGGLMDFWCEGVACRRRGQLASHSVVPDLRANQSVDTFSSVD